MGSLLIFCENLFLCISPGKSAGSPALLPLDVAHCAPIHRGESSRPRKRFSPCDFHGFSAGRPAISSQGYSRSSPNPSGGNVSAHAKRPPPHPENATVNNPRPGVRDSGSACAGRLICKLPRRRGSSRKCFICRWR